MVTPLNQPKVDITYQLILESTMCHDQPMVAKEKIREKFSNRLHLACDTAGVRARGRATDIQEMLKRKKISVTTTAIGKWLKSEAIPEPEKLRPLAQLLGVRAAWLEYGDEPMLPSSKDVKDQLAISAALASPQSRSILDSISQAAEDGLLTDGDVELLEMVVQRIMARATVPTTVDPLDGSNTRLRNRLKNAPPDPDTQR